MTITEECINHNLALMVAEETEDLYEFTDKPLFVAMTLAEIRGASMLAEKLKEVLRL